jgi:cytochrome b involved in lipid metabolism
VIDFLDNHPGGAGVILKKAGQDATLVFDSLILLLPTLMDIHSCSLSIAL